MLDSSPRIVASKIALIAAADTGVSLPRELIEDVCEDYEREPPGEELSTYSIRLAAHAIECPLDLPQQHCGPFVLGEGNVVRVSAKQRLLETAISAISEAQLFGTHDTAQRLLRELGGRVERLHCNKTCVVRGTASGSSPVCY